MLNLGIQPNAIKKSDSVGQNRAIFSSPSCNLQILLLIITDFGTVNSDCGKAVRTD
jgi:hypothetical protein